MKLVSGELPDLSYRAFTDVDVYNPLDIYDPDKIALLPKKL